MMKLNVTAKWFLYECVIVFVTWIFPHTFISKAFQCPQRKQQNDLFAQRCRIFLHIHVVMLLSLLLALTLFLNAVSVVNMEHPNSYFTRQLVDKLGPGGRGWSRVQALSACSTLLEYSIFLHLFVVLVILFFARVVQRSSFLCGGISWLDVALSVIRRYDENDFPSIINYDIKI